MEDTKTAQEIKNDLIELAYKKFISIKQERNDWKLANSSKARLLSHPVDTLTFESKDSLKEELDKIHNKKSTLSRTQRDFVQGLVNAVLYDIIQEQSKAQSAEDSSTEE